MDRAGLFAMLAPKAYGGLELHPVEAMRVWEAVARIDSAAAWNLVMNQAISAYAAWLPAEGARELFRDGPPTTAGALNPAGRGDEGRRWVADHRAGPVRRAGATTPAGWPCRRLEMDGGRPKLDPATGKPEVFGVFFPRTEAEILDTWHTLGMRGTGLDRLSPCATCSCRTG